MYGILLLLVLSNPYANLESDDYRVRKAATEQIFVELINEKEPIHFKKLQELTNSKDTPPETKFRAAILLNNYFSLANVELPIWHLPREYRYVNGRDLAHEYYKGAVGPNFENHPQMNSKTVMNKATANFIRHKLESREILWKDCHNLIVRMKETYIKEQMNGRVHFPREHKDVYGRIPGAVEDRLQQQEMRIDAINFPTFYPLDIVYNYYESEEDTVYVMFEG